MKRIIVLAALVLAGAFGVKTLGDATQTRADHRHHDQETSLVIHLDGKNYRQSLDTGAQALFGRCAATVDGYLVEPGIERIGPGQYRFAMTPSLGDHGKERLLGCLNDLSIDRLHSNVETVEDVPLAPDAARMHKEQTRHVVTH